MRKRLVMHCILCLACLAIALLDNNRAIAAQHSGVTSIICVEREVLLMTLVEAHGAFPNAASRKLAAESAALMRARTACDHGHSRDALVFYDRLIAELTASLAQKEK
jgi:hypothetical protein